MLDQRWLTPVFWPSALSLVLWSAEATAATRVVPTQFPTIQEAIWASGGTDTVLVLPGTYRENVVMDRYVVLRSAQGPQVTVIDGSDPRNSDSASTVRMMNGVIEGFDIRNGAGALEPFFSQRLGGGILGSGTVVIRGNWIHDNTLSAPRGAGGGIYVQDGMGTVVGNRIYGNRILSQQLGKGGGLWFAGFSSIIEQNEVYDNHVMRGEAAGASTNGLLRNNVVACNSIDTPFSEFSSSAVETQGPEIRANTIVANWCSFNDGVPAVFVWALDWEPPLPPTNVFGNNIVFNLGPGVKCLLDHHLGQVTFACNNIFANVGGAVVGECGQVIGQDGNIAVDPEFGRGSCPHTPGDWCLGPGSPLLPDNSPPGCGLIGAVGECPPIAVPEVERPGTFWALEPRPNPFAARTEIPFHLGESSEVEVEIYGVLGRKVRTLRGGFLGAGDHEIVWDARDDGGRRAAAGGYVAVIRAGSREVTRDLLLVW